MTQDLFVDMYCSLDTDKLLFCNKDTGVHMLKKKKTAKKRSLNLSTRNSLLLVVSLVAFIVMLLFVKQKQNLEQHAQNNAKVYFGAALGMAVLQDPGTLNVLTHYGFNIITPENELKMDATQPTATSFNYTNADQIIAFAKNNNMAVHGHTLVWHNQVPSWVSSGNYSADQLATILKNRITTLMQHYAGQFYSWDVVNEALDDSQTGTGYKLRPQSESCSSGTCKNIWGKINSSTTLANSGYPDYVTLAFSWARQADSNHTVKLYYNDYNIEDITTAKGKASFNLVKQLYARGLIDGVGLQMHVGTYLTDAAGWQTKVANTIAQYATLGPNFEVAISEMDVKLDNSSLTQQQANIYDAVAKACGQSTACKRFTTWGVTDKFSWLNPDTSGKYWYPLLFDSAYNPKTPAWNYVQNDLAISPIPTATPVASSTPAPSSIPTITPTPIIGNVLQNNSFETTGTNWLSPWIFQTMTGASGSISHVSTTKVDGTYSANVSITQSNTNAWYVQLLQGSLPLTQNRTYTISFWAKASKNRAITAMVQQNNTPYNIYFQKTFNLNTSWQQYTTTFTQTTTDSNTMFNFNFANATGNVWIDKVSLQ